MHTHQTVHMPEVYTFSRKKKKEGPKLSPLADLKTLYRK